MAKKKVLFVVEAMGGGVLTYITDLANALAEQFDINIAYAVRPQTPENFKASFDQRIHFIEVPHFTREINPVKDLRAMSEIKKIVRDIKPDVIHFHSSKAGAIGRLAFSGRSTPLFYTPHGYSFLMEDCSPIKRAAYRQIESILAKRRCTTISCSPGEHEETVKMTQRAKYVNNGINIAEMERMLASVNRSEHPFTVFTLGRICHQKNPALFNSIAEAMPDAHFLWIGDGELRHELKSGNVEITGWVNREEALQKSMNADVFLLTSLWEGLPISLLEAMYMKKLCVVSDVIGNHDVIRSGENGFVCNSVEEYIKAIETHETKALTEAAYNDIMRTYNTAVMGKQYARIYEGV